MPILLFDGCPQLSGELAELDANLLLHGRQDRFDLGLERGQRFEGMTVFVLDLGDELLLEEIWELFGSALRAAESACRDF